MDTKKLSRSPFVWMVATFLMAAAISGVLALQQTESNRHSAQKAFEAQAEDIVVRLQQRIRLYEYGLRGARAAVVTAGENGINSKLFRQYSETRDFTEEFPGARGFGFIRRVPRTKTDAYLQARQADGISDFSIRSLNEYSDERFVIEYIEPIERNRVARGLDIGSEANRRQAAISALQTGKATITGPITLVQSSGDPQRSVLFLLPVYRSGVTPSDIDQREALGFGWTYAPLALSEVLADFGMAQLQYDLAITDVSNPSQQDTVFDSKRSGASGQSVITQMLEREIYGRLWRFDLIARPGFVAGLGQFSGRAVFTVGLGVSLLISLLVGALRAGKERKRKALVQQAQLATIVESSADAIVGETAQGKVIIWNPAAEHLFGFTKAEALGQEMSERMTVAEDAQKEERLFNKVMSTGESEPIDITLLAKSGRQVPVSVTASAIRGERGQIIGVARFMRDIRDRQAAEKAMADMAASLEKQVVARTAELETARHDLQTVLDSVPSMIGYWDKNLLNRVANRAYGDWFGVDPANLQGRHMQDLLGEKLFELNRPYIEGALTGEKQRFERTIPRVDGSGMRHSLANYLPDVVGGEVRGFYVIVHDVTEVVVSRQAIAHERERLQHIIEGTNVGTWEWNVQTGELVINERWAEIIGYSREELSPATIDTWKAHVHPEDLPGAQALLSQHFDEVQPQYQSVIRMRHKLGHWVWVQSRGKVYTRASDGQPEWMYGTHHDITATKEAEAQLQEAVAILRGVLNAATQQSIIATDADGTITLFNTGAEHMLGYGANELVGKSTPAPLHLREEVEAYGLELTRRYGMPIHGFRVFVHEAERLGHETREWTYVRKDGHQLRVQLSVNTIRDLQGNMLGYLGIAQDMTERHRRDTELRHAKAAAEKASIAKSMFLANMSHEIRTPMNAVLGVAHLLVDTPLNDDQRLLLSKLQIAGRSLLGIINDVLDISKIEAGEMTTESVAFAPSDLVAELIQLYSAQAESKGIQLQAKALEHLPSVVEGDPTRLRQVLSNLVSNAIKFTTQGTVTIAVERLPSAGPNDLRAWLKFSVADTGEGISERALQNLFKPFAQADSSTTRRFGGTGLGLSIVKRLSQLMGGDVGVESAPGVGSTFWAQLPFTILDEALSAAHPAAQHDPLNVFVADDNEIDLEGLVRMCQAFGWRTTAVPSGRELLHRLETIKDTRQKLPDALVVDWKMPGLDGIETLNALAERWGPSAMPATLVVSAHERDSVARNDHSGVVNHILTKPVNPSTLFNAINASVAAHTGNHNQVLASTRLESMRGHWLHGMRILLVDDSEINLEVARRLLEKEGASVEVATNGREALDLLQSDGGQGNSFDAVLMDVHMPVMDGYEATSLARSQLGLTELPIIALTAGALAEEKQRADAVGMTAFLTKPLDPALLAHTVHMHVNKARGNTAVYESAEATKASHAQTDWPEIEGISASVASKLLQGDPVLFADLLRRFVKDYGRADFVLSPGHTADQRREFVARVHKLRGSAGMLGAVALHSIASSLENTLRRLDTESEKHDEFTSSAAMLIASLNGALRELVSASSSVTDVPANQHHSVAGEDLGSVQIPPIEQLDAAQAQRLFNFLQLLSRQDLAAMEQVDTLASDLTALLGSQNFVLIREAISALDFAAATQMLVARLPDRQ
ncbi:MAG: PAS domain S-box protein [Gammaproteobacteria bacterium]|nr:PAS domain S-box protein [Gammaproteobacteria bacterium]MBU1506813.1 PAS domain S-box protein [Gammaproteobacteria bacterium]MBU2121986.1 PAS domain S-box protein [Gammaproteobacteria bacterium]MBU2277140.1 PAS domain S-box protein [Gammaproteobacteria bacterium]MBU2356237.1 PAS domain S-box protein [Gammaproteobacteria bacterium]